MSDRRYQDDRPPSDERWTNDRREPVRIEIRTTFRYSDSPPIRQPDGSLRAAHAYSRGGVVTGSDVPSSSKWQQAITDHLWRAIAAFGDDVDLVIEVRRKSSSLWEPPAPCTGGDGCPASEHADYCWTQHPDRDSGGIGEGSR